MNVTFLLNCLLSRDISQRFSALPLESYSIYDILKYCVLRCMKIIRDTLPLSSYGLIRLNPADSNSFNSENKFYLMEIPTSLCTTAQHCTRIP